MLKFRQSLLHGCFILLFSTMAYAAAAPLIVRYEYDASGNRVARSVIDDDAPVRAKKTASVLDPPCDSLSVNVFPNPTYGEINIRIANPNGQTEVSLIQILDMSGRLVFNGVFHAPDFQVDISNCAAGVYLLKIRTGGRETSRRVVKL